MSRFEASRGSVPTVTFIVCTYNRKDMALACIESILGQMREAPSWRTELVVVDNNSTDGTTEFLGGHLREESGVRLIREPAQGLSHARNAGARAARGDYLCYIDDDGRISSGYLPNLLAILDGQRPDFVGGPVVPFYTSRKPFWFQDVLEIRRHADTSGFHDCPLSGGNFVVRRDLLEALGMFSTAFGMVGDTVRLGDERELLERYRQSRPASAWRTYYALECVLLHHVPDRKMKLSYFARRAYESGRTRARIDRADAGRSSVTKSGGASVPRGLLRRIVLGRRGVYLPVRALHWTAFAIGMLVQRIESTTSIRKTGNRP